MRAVESKPQLSVLFAMIIFLLNKVTVSLKLTVTYLITLRTKLTPASLCLNDGLVAGPKEVFFTDDLYQVGAFQHLPGIIVDSRKHERAALFVESFMQAMNYFDASRIDQRNAAHG